VGSNAAFLLRMMTVICNRADLDKAIDWLGAATPSGERPPGFDSVRYRDQYLYRARATDGRAFRNHEPWRLAHIDGHFLVAPWLVDELPGLREFL
jgi:hypothetical protein